MMYNEVPFLERFEAAARDGFKAVEFLFPYDHDMPVLAQLLREHGLKQVLFNAPPGGTNRESIAAAWQQVTRGIAILPVSAVIGRLENNRLRVLPLQRPTLGREIVLLSLKLPMNTKAYALAELMRLQLHGRKLDHELKTVC